MGKVSLRKIRPQNYVVCGKIPHEGLSLDSLSKHEKTRMFVTYNKSNFPGAILIVPSETDAEETFAVNLFKTGKFVIPGVSSVTKIKEIHSTFLRWVKKYAYTQPAAWTDVHKMVMNRRPAPNAANA